MSLDRLVQSELDCRERELDEGFQLGKDWATQVAEYDELKRVADPDETWFVGSVPELAEVATGGGDAWVQILFVENAFGDVNYNASLHEVIGFLDGASAVWRELTLVAS